MTVSSAAQSTSVHSSGSDVPSNIFKPTAPLEARVLENKRLTAEDSPNDVRHLVFDIGGNGLQYHEGQSIGILPPGTDAAGKPYKLRLYSIASARQGDDGQHKTLSLCVKRAITTVPETGEVFKGVCSSFLCDLKAGDTAKLTGPVGKSFLLPPSPDANLVMVATGTGIAPFRAFLRHRDPAAPGQAWLFFGAQTRQDYLYQEEMEAFDAQKACRVITAFSREEKNSAGGKMYVQHRLAEHGETLFALLKQPNTYFYMCGLRGMEAGIQEGLQGIAESEGIAWADFVATLKSEKRWHIEVY